MADPTSPEDPGTPPAPADAPVDPEKAAMAEALAKANAEAKKYRLEAKAQAEALEKLNQASMTDLERAVAEAKSSAYTDALRTVGARLVDAEVRAAAAGRPIDVKALLDGLDRNRFLTDDGEPDVDAITKFLDRIAPLVEPSEPRRAQVPTGPRGGPPPTDDAASFAAFRAAQLNR